SQRGLARKTSFLGESSPFCLAAYMPSNLHQKIYQHFRSTFRLIDDIANVPRWVHSHCQILLWCRPSFKMVPYLCVHAMTSESQKALLDCSHRPVPSLLTPALATEPPKKTVYGLILGLDSAFCNW
ncbi:mCG145020, partial [Mus musculus]